MRSLDIPYEAEYGQEGVAHLRQFDHMGELVDLGATIDQETYGMDRDERASLYSTATWAGSVSMGATVKLGRMGWPEGTDRLAEIVDNLDMGILHATSLQPELHYDVVGEEPDVGAYLMGEPENMIDWRQPPEDGTKMIEFIVNASASADVPARHILERGAGIVAAAQALEATGHSVGITAAFPIQSGYLGYGRTQRALCHYVPLSSPGRYFDLDTVAFGLANPSVFRRLIFSAMEQEPAEIKHDLDIRRSGYYGYPDKVRFIPESEYKGIILSGGYGQSPLELAQELIDVATNRKEAGKAQVGHF